VLCLPVSVWSLIVFSVCLFCYTIFIVTLLRYVSNELKELLTYLLIVHLIMLFVHWWIWMQLDTGNNQWRLRGVGLSCVCRWHNELYRWRCGQWQQWVCSRWRRSSWRCRSHAAVWCCWRWCCWTLRIIESRHVVLLAVADVVRWLFTAWPLLSTSNSTVMYWALANHSHVCQLHGPLFPYMCGWQSILAWNALSTDILTTDLFPWYFL